MKFQFKKEKKCTDCIEKMSEQKRKYEPIYQRKYKTEINFFKNDENNKNDCHQVKILG